MKAEIQNDGYLHITPETPTEAYALLHISKNDFKVVPKDLIKPFPIVVSYKILDNLEASITKGELHAN